MRFRVDQIKGDELVLSVDEAPEAFPELPVLESESGLRFDQPVHGQLRLQCIGNLVELHGTLATTVEMACGRCLRRYRQPLATEFDLTLRPLGEMPRDEVLAEEQELRAEDLGQVPVYGETIDLIPVLQEQVLLALPLQPLCNENCPGLCLHCGADRNEGDCGCRPEPLPGPFAVLKDLGPRS